MEIKQYTLEDNRSKEKPQKNPKISRYKCKQNITCQNSQDVTKVRRKLKAVNAYTKRLPI